MKKLLLAGAALLASASPSQATVIADTGGNPAGTPWAFARWQYFAGEVTLAQGYTINSVEGYFANSSGSAGTVTAQLFSDGGNVPGTLLFSQAFNLNGVAPLDWYGATGLNWSVGAGSYWLAFAPDANVSGIWPGDAPSPLDEYAQASGGAWQNVGPNAFDYLDVGVRISGTPNVAAAVPEPATWLMMLVGFGAIGAALRRRSNPAVKVSFG